jgi:hypothetical protein
MTFPPAPQDHSLTPHPASPPGPAREIRVSVRRDAEALLLQYRLEGDLDAVSLPPRVMPTRADDLWRHTCFEAFVGRAGLAAYREYNFSPSGAWAVYDFDRYREGMRTDSWIVAPGFMTRRVGAAYILDATIDIRWLAVSPGGPLRLGVTAVIEDMGGVLSYWALKHSAEKPDFHQPDSFVIELR